MSQKAQSVITWFAGTIPAISSVLLACAKYFYRAYGRNLRSGLNLGKSLSWDRIFRFQKPAIRLTTLDAVITIDATGRIVDFNPSAEHLFGLSYSAAGATQLNDFVRFPSAIKRRRFDDLAGTLESNQEKILNRRFETFAKHRSGKRIPVEFSFCASQVGKIKTYVVTLRDISERLRARSVLAESSGRWKLALEGYGDGVWDWDVQSDRVIYSALCLNILGYERGSIGSTHAAWCSLLHPDDHAGVMSELVEHLVGKQPNFSIECRFLSSCAGWKWIHARGTVVQRAKSSGSPLRMIGTYSDISDRKRIEAERGDLMVQSHQLTLELQRARAAELSVGTRIQQSLLTTRLNKRLTHLWLSTFNQASQGIDGDFIEVICLSEQTIDIVAGDVMGKGVNAALMGAAVKMQLSRSLIELTTGAIDSGRLPQPAEVVCSMHNEITPHLQALEAFVTLCYMRIDMRTNTLTWVGCGHEEALLARHRGTFLALGNQHPPLGVLDKVEFVQETTAMTALDSVFLHSDGLPDAILPNGERLGVYSVRTALARFLKVHKTPGAVLSNLRDSLLGDGVKFTDDLTMILATRADPNAAILRLELEVHLDSIAKVRTLVSEDALRLGFSETEASLVTVAAVEVFTNIVRHATGLLPGAPVEIISTRLPNTLQIELIYLGDFFQPDIDLQKPNLYHFPEGGFGLGIIHDVCDDVRYVYESGVNTVRLQKLAIVGSPSAEYAE
jgi:PAS domain S-box-containing protein